MVGSLIVDLKKIPRKRHLKTGMELIDEFADSVEKMFEVYSLLADLFTRPIPEKADGIIKVTISASAMDTGKITIVFSQDGSPLCAYDGDAK